MEWISVRDRLPEDGGRVLCWNNQLHTQTIQVYNKEYGCWDAEDGDDFEYSCKSETISHRCYMPGNPNAAGWQNPRKGLKFGHESELCQKLSASHMGKKKRVHKDGVNKWVDSENFSKFIEDGWEAGFVRSKKN